MRVSKKSFTNNFLIMTILTLSDHQKQVAAKVLYKDSFGAWNYQASDIIGLDFDKENNFFNFKTSQGSHPIHKDTFLQYKEEIEKSNITQYKDEFVKVCSQYGYEGHYVESNNSYHVYQYQYGKRISMLNVNFDSLTNSFWYRPFQNFDNPVNAFKAWATRNYKQAKLSARIKLLKAS